MFKWEAQWRYRGNASHLISGFTLTFWFCRASACSSPCWSTSSSPLSWTTTHDWCATTPSPWWLPSSYSASTSWRLWGTNLLGFASALVSYSRCFYVRLALVWFRCVRLTYIKLKVSSVTNHYYQWLLAIASIREKEGKHIKAGKAGEANEKVHDVSRKYLWRVF